MTSDDYQETMKALAAQQRMRDESIHRIEHRLLGAMALRERTAIGSHGTTVPNRRRAVTWRQWMPVAAGIMLVTGAAITWWSSRPVPNIGAVVPPKVVAETAEPGHRTVLDNPSQRTASEGSVPHVQANGKGPARPARGTKRSEFVELPWTAGLPAFESGEIVRMDLPIASLPAYGIDISPGTGSSPVQADILIGQDGFARAIRLVNSNVRSTQ